MRKYWNGRTERFGWNIRNIQILAQLLFTRRREEEMRSDLLSMNGRRTLFTCELSSFLVG